MSERPDRNPSPTPNVLAPVTAGQGVAVKPVPYGYVVEMRQDGYPPILWKRSRVQWSLMDAERTAAEWQSMIERLSFLSKRTTRIIPLFAALATPAPKESE